MLPSNKFTKTYFDSLKNGIMNLHQAQKILPSAFSPAKLSAEFSPKICSSIFFESQLIINFESKTESREIEQKSEVSSNLKEHSCF